MSRAALFENILQIFCSSNREAVAWSFNFQLPEYGWNDMRSRRSFLLDSVCYHGDVMTILNFNWFNLKILMSGRYRKLTSMCFIYNISAMPWQYWGRCHSDIVTISKYPMGECFKMSHSIEVFEFFKRMFQNKMYEQRCKTFVFQLVICLPPQVIY